MEGAPPITVGELRAIHSVRFSPASDLVAVGSHESVVFFSLKDGRAFRSFDLGGYTVFERKGSHLWSLSRTSKGKTAVRKWTKSDHIPDVFSVLDFDLNDYSGWNIDASGEWLASRDGDGVYISPLRNSSREGARFIGKHESRVVWTAAHPTASRILSVDAGGEGRLWGLSDTSAGLERAFRAPAPEAVVDKTDSWVAFSSISPHSTSAVAYLHSLTGPPDAEPLVLRNGNATWVNTFGFEPLGRWLFTAHDTFGISWPLQAKPSSVLRGQAPPAIQVGFTPDGSGLVSTSDEGVVRLWPLSFRDNERRRILMEDKSALLGFNLGVDPSGRRVLVGSRFDPRVFLVPLDGSPSREMPGFTRGQGWVHPLAFSLDGRLAAAAGMGPAILRVWDLETEEVRELDLRVTEECEWGEDWEGFVGGVEFLADGRLLTLGVGGLRLWNLESGKSDRIVGCTAGKQSRMDLASNGARSRFLVLEIDEDAGVSNLSSFDLEGRVLREIASHGKRVSAATLDPSGTIVVTGDPDGIVRVGPIDGGTPHLLYGHTLQVSSVAVSPDGKWIASASQDGTIRLWPMPEGTPFHTLPYEQILERLRRLTNLRIVPDDSSATGYRVEIGPFPGWQNAPGW